MIVADTSAWLAMIRGEDQGRRLRDLIGKEADIGATEPVLMEILAGARSVHESDQLRRLLTSRGWLPFDSAVDFEAAAQIYAIARRRGVKPGTVDCMIVSVAARNDATLMTLDRKQAEVAQLIGVEVA